MLKLWASDDGRPGAAGSHGGKLASRGRGAAEYAAWRQFSVYLKAPATRDGRARCKLTELWAASGTMPAQQPRKVSVASGWRHEHRPSSYAKQVSGAHAKAIDHVTSDRHAAASWATDEPAPFEAKQDDV